MVLDDFRCSSMISKTRKNIEITRLQGSSVNFNELPYITLKASPKRKVVGSNPARNAILEGGDRKIGSRFFYLSRLSGPI